MKSSKVIAAIIILFIILLGWEHSLLRADISAQTFPSLREFELSYTAEIPIPSAHPKEIRVWAPLGISRDGQKILRLEIESEIPYQISQELEQGNELLYFTLQSVIPDKIHFQVKYRAVTDLKEFAQQRLPDPRRIQRYLQPTRLMVINEEVRQRSRIAAEGRQSTREKAEGIYESVLSHMKYDKIIPGWGQGDTLRACQVGAGNCTDFHSLFISMAQAAQIPARFKIGVTIPDQKEGEIPGYHCWAEFYEEGTGWIPIDASDAWKNPQLREAYFGNFDTNKFFVSTGRDIELIPQQRGKPVNIFFYPYVEIDGEPFYGSQVSLHYRNLTK